MSFSSGSERRGRIRIGDLSAEEESSIRRGGVSEIPLTVGYCTDRWTTEDRVVRTRAKLTGSGVNRVREVGWIISRH